ncbi:MAG: MarR family transcriptional regulator [Clostridia bacterium]|nr:MarR family transcriptional regulator [Clostridia bacterium]
MKEILVLFEIHFWLWGLTTTLFKGLEKVFKKYNVTEAQVLVTLFVFSRKGLNFKILSEYMMNRQTTLTTIVDKLESKGILVRIPDKQDRRNILLELTEEGKTTIRSIVSESYQVYREISVGLPEYEQLLRMRADLRRLAASLGIEEHFQVCMPGMLELVEGAVQSSE